MSIFKQILQPRPAGPGDPELPAVAEEPESHSALEAGHTQWRRRILSGLWRLLHALRLVPELAVLGTGAGMLDFWVLKRNGFANVYYAAAVRSMARNWHNFWYASFDPNGVMSIDKSPLAVWIQALSVRIFGFHSESILIPEAVIGVITVLVLYDLVRRCFGRIAGFVAGAALATTPITVAMSRHNNPDALVTLCCVAAVWFLVRALKDGKTRWIVLSGVMVGLGFETKMGVALVVVPGIVLAWLWMRPKGWHRTLDQLVLGGLAMTLVAAAWPLLIAFTPASQRPWIAGTSDNNILSLIFGYNGFGRVGGQRGGPSSTLGVFVGPSSPVRLLNSALGGQAGWLLGLGLAGLIAGGLATRMRRSDPRTGWLIAVGGSFVAAVVLFSTAQGIFHPYYVSLLAPFTAALAGAAVGVVMRWSLGPRLVGGLVGIAVVAGAVAVELVVLADYHHQLGWIQKLDIAVGVGACLLLLGFIDWRVRAPAILAVAGALIVAPAIWSVDTLAYATSSTFPAGGPAKDNTAEAFIVSPPTPALPAVLAPVRRRCCACPTVAVRCRRRRRRSAPGPHLALPPTRSATSRSRRSLPSCTCTEAVRSRSRSSRSPHTRSSSSTRTSSDSAASRSRERSDRQLVRATGCGWSCALGLRGWRRRFRAPRTTGAPETQRSSRRWPAHVR